MMMVPTDHGPIEVRIGGGIGGDGSEVRISGGISGDGSEVRIGGGIGGEKPLVVMLPSLGRGASDFDRLAADVAGAGYRVACPEPRGLGNSAVAEREETLMTLADDVADVIRSLGGGPAFVVGHAYGNRIARMTATRHPELVEGLVLLACGGFVPVSAEMGQAIRTVFDARQSPEARLEAVTRAFFAPGNDASVWSGGWDGSLAQRQERATVATAVDDWWAGGRAPMLAVQPLDDKLAVPANAEALVEAAGDRVEVVFIPNAGHALLPEQPKAVADAVIGWLDRQRAGAAA